MIFIPLHNIFALTTWAAKETAAKKEADAAAAAAKKEEGKNMICSGFCFFVSSYEYSLLVTVALINILMC